MLENLTFPEDLKTLSQKDLESLAAELRAKLLDIGDECGGHLASNLGVVELTIALHTALESPEDKIIWDVSHQSYVHKMLTGRFDQIMTLRKEGGLSGFTRREESLHDPFGAGHASTALSAGLGMAHARDLKKESYRVCAVIGDGSFSGGMSFEALNNVGRLDSNFICILNDNDMSISKPVGSMARIMTRMRASRAYDFAKDKVAKILDTIPMIGGPLKERVGRAVDNVKDFFINVKEGVIFEEFGFKYLGPLDGHNIPLLIWVLKYAKNYNGPIMIHVMTKKGKGHELAEEQPEKFHGVSPKSAKKKTLGIEVVEPQKETDEPQVESRNADTYTDVFGDELVKIARENEQVVAITPAMKDGSGLSQFAHEFPDRFFDVGIAEEHAVTFAAGLAGAGVIPILAIYSTFLQRGFDQVIHDVCLQNLPVIFALDRAGLVGADGPTHHGVFDYNFLLMIPNMTILAPKDGDELRAMLRWAVGFNGPVSIRYPKGSVPNTATKEKNNIELGKGEVLFEYKKPLGRRFDTVFIAAGSMVGQAAKSAQALKESGKSTAVINIRFIKPFDVKLIKRYVTKAKSVVVLEEGQGIGGVYAYILQQLSGLNIPLSHIKQIALPDTFIEHGSISSLKEKYLKNVVSV